MANSASIYRRELRRAAAPVSLAIALFWVAPITITSIIAARQQDSALGQAWSNGWYVLYLLSLLAWKLPDTWFQVRPWEATGRIYESLGVRWFKQFMIGGDRHNRRIRERVGAARLLVNPKDMNGLKEQSVISERVHVVMFLFVLWPTLLALLFGWWVAAAVICACNIVVNVYPIMLQRYTRSRIAMLFERKTRMSNHSFNGDVARATHR